MALTDEERAKLDALLATVDIADAEAPTGGVPPGMFLNPETGQYTSREMLAANIPPERWRAGVGGAMQGSGFQFGDEVIGGVSGAGKYAMSGGSDDPELAGMDEATLADWIKFERERARATLESDAGAFPGAALAGEVAGAAGSGLATGGAAASVLGPGKSLLGRVGQGMVLGAGEGAVYGAGRGEGVEGRLRAGANDAAWGAGVGGALPLAMAGGKAAYNAVRDPFSGIVDALTDKASTRRTNTALSRIMDTSGMTPAQVDAALDAARRAGVEGMTAADVMGGPGARALNGLARAGGDPADEIIDYLTSRQAAQPERVAGYVEDAFDLGGSSAKRLRDAATKVRTDTANINFPSARANARPVDIRSAVGVIDDYIGPTANAPTKPGAIEKTLKKYRDMLAGVQGDEAFELSNFDRVFKIRQEVRDAADAAFARNRGALGAELKKLRVALDEALEGASDEYRGAMDAFRDQSRVIDAFDTGAASARPGQRGVDTLDIVGGMTPEQRKAAGVGYGDRMLSMIEGNSSPTANRAKMFGSPKREMEVGALAADPAKFKRQMSLENDMWKMFSEATQGSRTANNLADMADVAEQSTGILGLLRGGAPTSRGLIGSAIDKVLPIAKGQNEATRRKIAEALLATDPTKLIPAADAQQAGRIRDMIVDALMRGTTRPAVAEFN